MTEMAMASSSPRASTAQEGHDFPEQAALFALRQKMMCSAINDYVNGGSAKRLSLRMDQIDALDPILELSHEDLVEDLVEDLWGDSLSDEEATGRPTLQ